MPQPSRLETSRLNLERLGFTRERRKTAIAIHALTPRQYADTSRFGLDAEQRQWLEVSGFVARPGKWSLVPPTNQPIMVLIIVDDQDWRSWAEFARQAPAGQYCYHRIDPTVLRGWSSGHYRFTINPNQDKSSDQDKNTNQSGATLYLPDDIDNQDCLVADAEYHVRHLIDSPANIMTTDVLAAYAREMFGAHSVYPAPERVQHIVGDDLLGQNFPLIHTVGRASGQPPQLLDLHWPAPSATENTPLITVIGKGICFDSGGLDIKPRAAMLSMKKDMGGAAHAIGTIALLLQRGIDARLRLILGIAENAISGEAFRPGDILTARNGKTIEVGDTDAEGRLVLADCLCLAGEASPDTIIDFATLTGAARVALGADLPALFCNDDDWASLLTAQADDPLWHLPLHAPYASQTDGRISDYNSAPGGGLAGAITAALFLQHFVPEGCRWAHIDLMAYAPSAIHGRATGAAAQGMFAVAKFPEALSAQVKPF